MLADRPAEELRERPLDIDRREIGHVGGDQRRLGIAAAVGDRRPRQVVGVLALDQVGPEALERAAHRAVAQHQPVVRASRDMRRRDRDGDRAVLLDDLVARAGNDHRCRCGVESRMCRRLCSR